MSMPEHVLTLVGFVAAFFGLLWFGTVVLGQTPERALGLSALTLILLGAGALYTASTLRPEDETYGADRHDR